MSDIKGAEERGFKGIWIPAEIWLRDDINVIDKVLLSEIDSLDQGEGCFASNTYLSKFVHISVRRLQEIIQSLKDKNLVEQIAFDGRRRWLKVNKIAIYSSCQNPSQTCGKVHLSETDLRKSAPLTCGISHPYNKDDNKDECIKNTLSVPNDVPKEVHVSKANNSKPKKKKAKRKFNPNSVGGKLSQILLDEIERHNPTFPTPDLSTWQGTFNKMIFIQGYRFGEITKVIRFSQQDKFWRPFIINPFAFAAKYETLKIQWMQSEEEQSEEEEDIFEQAKKEGLHGTNR